MSILDKHPAPWAVRGGYIIDANDKGGASICLADVVANVPTWMDADIQCLILAAPELLAALKLACDYYHGCDPVSGEDYRERHRALIERIEKGGGT